MSFDLSPEILSKTEQVIGSGWVGNAIGILVLVSAALVWWRNEPKQRSDDISTQILKHDALKSISEIEDFLKRANVLLQENNDMSHEIIIELKAIGTTLKDLDRGQKHSHRWYQQFWNWLNMGNARKRGGKNPLEPPEELDP